MILKDNKDLNRILHRNPLAFTNVRHPFERLRLVSGYIMLKAYQDVKEKSFLTFIIEANASEDKMTFSKMNSHLRPSNTYCAFCNINYTVISKTETFNEDKLRILEMAGLENKEKELRMNVFGGDSIGDVCSKLFKDIPKDVKTALLDLYKYDFSMFDYDPYLY